MCADVIALPLCLAETLTLEFSKTLWLCGQQVHTHTCAVMTAYEGCQQGLEIVYPYTFYVLLKFLLLGIPICWHLSSHYLIYILTGQILTEIHLNSLLDELESAATKWSRIGLKLGFKYSELESIKNTATLIVQRPIEYLREMLAQWLKWASPNHPDPTIKKLVQALRGVGEERLALNLEQSMFNSSVPVACCYMELT